MKKQALIQLHRLYLEATDFLGENLEDTAYEDLSVGINASKDEHKRALYIISEYLGNNFEDIRQPNWDYDEGSQSPDLSFGNVALEQPEDKAHDTVVINRNGEEMSRLTWLRGEVQSDVPDPVGFR